jgi:hypothetical protein
VLLEVAFGAVGGWGKNNGYGIFVGKYKDNTYAEGVRE